MPKNKYDTHCPITWTHRLEKPIIFKFPVSAISSIDGGFGQRETINIGGINFYRMSADPNER